MSEPNAWHHLSIQEIFSKRDFSPAGLSSSAATERLTHFGPNRIPPAKEPALLYIFLRQFHHILIYVLIIAAMLTIFLEHWIDTSVIIAVILINAIIGFIQENKAKKAIDAIRKMLVLKAVVIRDGERHTIPAESLVLGDVVLLEAGDKVPADCRLFETHGLQTQEAILTGESLPVEKHPDPVAQDTPIACQSSMAFCGTLITSGQGKGLVVHTGQQTQIGQISEMLSSVEKLTTPLVTQMNVFAKWLTGIILIIGLLLMAGGYFISHYSFTDIFMIVVGLVVAAIPEGLPAVLTITLAIGVKAMAARQALIRRLPVIETIGSVSVICSDKTGTLSCNEMMVQTVITSSKLFTLTGSGYDPAGDITCDNHRIEQTPSDLRAIIEAAVLCNEAALHFQAPHWIIEGDPMEAALLVLAKKAQQKTTTIQNHWARTDAIPFDAHHRFMATLHHDHQKHGCIFIKGAPEKILSHCAFQLDTDGKQKNLEKSDWIEKANSLTHQGQRVLAIAKKLTASDKTILNHADIETDLVLLGLVGLIDPPREGVVQAIADCYQAGVDIKMITGDHANTASAIGKSIGLRHPDHILTGTEIDAMDDACLANAVKNTTIFARTHPAHKLRLVMALQANHQTVAMTGDGVNDAPALKRADAGIAMGDKGSEVAKEAADVVLTDDNFASIVAAIREGRTVYDNLKKVITWTLPTNAGESATILVAVLLGLALPVTPVQILWVNLITAITLGLALAFEPTEPRTMHLPPRHRQTPLVDGVLAWQIGIASILYSVGVFGIFDFAIKQGYSLSLARTFALNTIVVMEIFYLFFVRNIHGTSLTLKAVLGTKVIWLTVAIVTLAQFAITYVPALQVVFGTESIPILQGFIIIGIGIAFFAIIEMEKQIRLRWKNKKAPQLRGFLG